MTAQRTDEGHQLPTSVWDRIPPPNRGRSALLTPEEIARAAIGIADAEGLPAASVKRVATRLRVPSPRLAQYLTSRDELFDLMLDTCLGDVLLPSTTQDVGDWRAHLDGIAHATYRLAREHPCLVELIGGRSPSGPNGLHFVETALTAFEGTGLGVRAAALYFNALLSFVCGAVGVETRYGRAADRRRTSGDAQYLTHTVSAEAYPRLAALFADAPDLSSEEAFDHGLACLLDGIAARVAGAGAPDGGP